MFLIFFQIICGVQFSTCQFNVETLKVTEFFDEELCFEGLLVASEITPPLLIQELIEMENINGSLTNKELEKTPMTIINEISRHNKIENKYMLIDEIGPSHKKTFKIKLELGAEFYHGVGTSIRKAQQEAASTAVQLTGYKRPQPKVARSNLGILPTVSLNTIAMKYGTQPVYTHVNSACSDTSQIQKFYDLYCVPNQCSAECASFNSFQAPQSPCERISLKVLVNGKEYFGHGYNIQNAKNMAASAAIADINSGNVFEQKPQPEKSPISIIHEQASKLDLTVNFEIINEFGAPHLRTYETKCTIGQHSVVGIATGKHASKLNAAEKMLKMISSPEFFPSLSTKLSNDKKKKKKKPKKSVLKMSASNLDPNDRITMDEDSIIHADVDPVNQLQSAVRYNHGSLVYPSYVQRDIIQNGRLMFETTVKVKNAEFVATATSMKESKKSAARGMLKELGYQSQLQDEQRKNTITKTKNSANINRPKLMGKQLAPGLMLVSNSELPGEINKKKTRAELNNVENDKYFENIERIVNGEKYLNEVTNLFGIKVQYVDLPRTIQQNYVTKLQLVFPDHLPVTSGKHRMCSGAGNTVELSRDKAATKGLKLLWLSGFVDVICHDVSDWNNVHAKITVVPDMLTKSNNGYVAMK